MTYAAFNGSNTLVDYLYKNNADINHQDRLKRTPLHWACRYNQSEMALNLLRLGADYDCMDFEGKKAVEIALD
jgi:ankyrin repeat protein